MLRYAALALIEEHGPISCSALGELMGLSREAARNHVKVLADQDDKVIYIADWTPALGYGRGSSGPMWAAGDKTDAPKPPQLGRRPKAERTEEDEAEYSEKRLMIEIRNKAKLIRPFRHWQDIAFFGEAA